MLVVDVADPRLGGRLARRRRSWIAVSQVATIYYFAHFLIILPIISRIERPLAAAQLDQRARCCTARRRKRAAGGHAPGRRTARRLAAATVRVTGIAALDHGPCASAFLVGLGFVGVLLISLFVSAATIFATRPRRPPRQEFHKHPKPLQLASDGPFGKFDEQQLQRGFQVYKEVCAACHGLNLVAFRDLAAARLYRGRGEGDRRPVGDPRSRR